MRNTINDLKRVAILQNGKERKQIGSELDWQSEWEINYKDLHLLHQG